MLNFPGLRGLADVRGGGPHAGAPGAAKEEKREKERQETVLSKPPSHIFAPTLYLMSRHAGGQGKPYVQEDSLK